jgi:16S rRNA (guanine966-N2)-methyltransferase
MLRIIAGRARGTRLEVAGAATRPMDGRARGALFNILQTELADARVLDLYAGSGALGLEALSRGAAECVFVERDLASAAALGRNLEAAGLAGGELSTLPAAAALCLLQARARSFSLVFFDPPFRQERSAGARAATVAELAAAAELLTPGGCLVWRLERRNFYPEDLPATLALADRREYGRSLLVFLRRRPAAAPAPPGEAPAAGAEGAR